MNQVYIKIDVSDRYHKAFISERIFTFSFTSIGFSALQKWLNEVAPNSERIYSIEPENYCNTILTRRLRSIGCQVAESKIIQTNSKASSRLFAPNFQQKDQVERALLFD